MNRDSQRGFRYAILNHDGRRVEDFGRDICRLSLLFSIMMHFVGPSFQEA